MDAAAVAIVVATLGPADRRVVTWYRKVIMDVQDGDQVFRYTGSRHVTKVELIHVKQTLRG